MALFLPGVPRYGGGMSKHPDRDDADLIRNPAAPDPLAEIYREMVTPDVEEMNEHADRLAEESRTEPDNL